MIAGLRRKFVIINMACVLVVLLVVFAGIFISTYQQQIRDGSEALNMAMRRETGMPPERFSIGGKMPGKNDKNGHISLQPVFTVTLEEDSDVRIVDSGNVNVTDETMAEAVDTAIAMGTEGGTIASLNLRFQRQEMGRSVRYAFLDLSVSQQVLTSMVITLLLVGLGGLAAFFIISLFLSNWALRPVQKAWAQQQQFVADASHELKTPLTVILANLGILQAHPAETVGSQEQWIENTRVEATRMRSLVDGLLFLAKTDALEPPREWATFSLSDAMWRSALSFEPVAYEAGVTLTSDIAPGVEMLGDEGQLVQLINILLDNACKYAGDHGEVEAKLWQAQDKVYLAVKNTGDVIGPEELTHVFERFYRADQSRARERGGYGLGLSIAAQIVRQHNGKIAVASDAAQGTVFSVTLPHRKG